MPEYWLIDHGNDGETGIPLGVEYGVVDKHNQAPAGVEVAKGTRAEIERVVAELTDLQTMEFMRRDPDAG